MASWFDVAGFAFQEFSAGGVRTFAVVEGRAGSFPLLLLHPTPAASFVWSTTIQAIGRSRRIIAPDYPGWGRSRNRIESLILRLTRDGLRKWLIETANAQQCDKLDIMGLGDGAWLALEFLLAEPERVRRLGLLNLPLKRQTAVKHLLPWRTGDWNKHRHGKWLERESGLSETSRQLFKPMFSELLGGGWHAERSPDFPLSKFQNEVQTYREILRNFDGEVLLGWGAKSSGYDERLAAEFANGRQILLWHESTNFPMWEQPEQYEREITEFLR